MNTLVEHPRHSRTNEAYILAIQETLSSLIFEKLSEKYPDNDYCMTFGLMLEIKADSNKQSNAYALPP